jgi:membrane protein DedA with SNARE-associated domain
MGQDDYPGPVCAHRRTFAPFVAGIGAMTYAKFFLFNVVGGVAWVAICLFAGYWFGNIPWVAKHFEAVIMASSSFPCCLCL